jgi:hypothetical protein
MEIYMKKHTKLPLNLLLCSAVSLFSIAAQASESQATHTAQTSVDERVDSMAESQPAETDVHIQNEQAQSELEQKKAEFEVLKAALKKAELAAIEARINAEKAEEQKAFENAEAESRVELVDEVESTETEGLVSRLKSIIPMPKPSPKRFDRPMHDWNVRLDGLAFMYREANLEVDYYLNDYLSLGVMGRLSPASETDRYMVAGLRFNRFFKPHNQDGWFFSGQMYGIGEDACRSVTTDTGFNKLNGNDITEENSFCGLRRYSFGMELLQSYQWIYDNGFNVNIGLGGKYVFDIENEIKEKEDEYTYMSNGYYDNTSEFSPWQQGINPAMEASIGWAF